ncbi:deoxycytidyl transferase [Malassezia brasiliensis]|uniref:DNA repair protein REV1 n=1 Tax=Malassezia brasiliensis TaxID=1821822 RepID=A0AAF0DVV6_9BASI|nr:deoxycytidyl transferase [Malassezia brasiliensis]
MRGASPSSSSLLSDDPTFLEALAQVATPQQDASSSQAHAANAPSSSPRGEARGAQTTDDARAAFAALDELAAHSALLSSPEDSSNDASRSPTPARSPTRESAPDAAHHAHPAAAAAARKADADSDMYRAIGFGDWGTFLRNKRRKLKVQEHDLAPQLVSRALQGCVIYINGYTDPPYAELRRLIALHGGEHMPYLDQKRPCTHIVATRLTPKKAEEFRRYRVVLPGWVVASCEAGVRADWTKWRCPDTVSHTTLPLFAPKGTTDPAPAAPAAAPALLPSMAWRALAGGADEALEAEAEAAPVPASGAASNAGRDSQGTDLAEAPASPARMVATTHAELAAEHIPEATPLAEANAPSVGMRMSPVPRPAAPPAAAEAPPPRAGAEAVVPLTGARARAHASALLSDPSWRAEHTAVHAGFLAGFYSASRLHHLSTWKESLQELVSEALLESGRDPAPPEVRGARTLMHVDFDSFFVTVGLREHPALRAQPVAVCHASRAGRVSSTSEIASCNYHARAFGIKNGMSLGQARQRCAHLATIPYTFDAYYQVSLHFYTILLAIADTLQVVSVDEALIDVSRLVDELPHTPRAVPYALRERFAEHAATQAAPLALAEAIRDVIRDETQCEASIGVGANILQARLATRRAKPCGAFQLEAAAVPAYVAALDVRDLWGVGWNLCERFAAWLGTTHVGTILARTTQEQLVRQFGPKLGRSLWDKMHGLDTDRLQSTRVRQSVGAHISWGVRLGTTAELHAFVQRVCDEVARRAARARVVGAHVSIQLMERAPDAPVEAAKFLGHGECLTHHRSDRMRATNDPQALLHVVWPMVRKLNIAASEVRGLAISLGKLAPLSVAHEQPRLPWAPRAAPCAARVQPPVAPQHPDEPAAPSSAPARAAPAAARDEPLPTGRSPPAAGSPFATGEAPRAPTPPPPPSFQIPPASQIDPDTVDFLPEPMRARVAAAIEARKQRPPRSPWRSIATALGIDADVLAELPPTLRDEVLAEMQAPAPAANSPPSAPTTPRRRGFGQRTPSSTPRKSKSPRTPRQGTSPGQRPIAAYLSPRRRAGSPAGASVDNDACVFNDAPADAPPDGPTSPALRALSLDVDVFRALPPAVQAEVYAEHMQAAAQRGRLRRTQQRVPERTQAAWRRHAAEAAVLHEAKVRADAGTLAADDPLARAAAQCVGEPVEREPRASLVQVAPRLAPGASLYPAMPVAALRAQLSAWVRACGDDAPRAQDVEYVERVLLACVTPAHSVARLPSVVQALRWWRYELGAHPSAAWLAAYEAVCARVRVAVEQVWGARLVLGEACAARGGRVR